METLSYIFHEGEYFNESLEAVDLMEIKIANERAEIILRHPIEEEKVKLFLLEVESEHSMRLLFAKQEVAVLKACYRLAARERGIELDGMQFALRKRE